MAAPTETDIDVIQGATFEMQVTWADSTTNPVTPIPLTGYRARMQVRARAGTSGTPILDLASDGVSPSLTLEPSSATGVVAVRIGATDTALIRKNCAYDLFVINKTDDTDAVRLVFGKITISKSVTVGT